MSVMPITFRFSVQASVAHSTRCPPHRDQNFLLCFSLVLTLTHVQLLLSRIFCGKEAGKNSVCDLNDPFGLGVGSLALSCLVLSFL